jgi:hypothetical protein
MADLNILAIQVYLCSMRCYSVVLQAVGTNSTAARLPCGHSDYFDDVRLELRDIYIIINGLTNFTHATQPQTLHLWKVPRGSSDNTYLYDVDFLLNWVPVSVVLSSSFSGSGQSLGLPHDRLATGLLCGDSGRMQRTAAQVHELSSWCASAKCLACTGPAMALRVVPA